MAGKGNIENHVEREKRRPSRWLMYFYVIFLFLSIVIIVRIAQIQYVWKPNPEFVKHFLPSKHKEVIEPERGTIMDHDGRLLAISTPLYNIYMDCYVQKEANDKNTKTGKKDEEEWMNNARKLSQGLSEVLQEYGGKDSTYYWNRIRNGRANKKRYVSIVKGIDHGTLLELKKLPLFNLPSHKGGLVVEKEEKRLYPYGELARRVIGYVKHNNDTSSIHVGIEGKFHYLLHGEKGIAWERRTDQAGWIPDVDSIYRAATDGFDIRTTLDIDIQDIADKALRRNIADNANIAEGCVVIMDVKTGAIKAMVNLQKDSTGIHEMFNMAAGRPSEPGSVFKTVTMTTLLEDGKITLDQEIPTNHGVMSDMADLIPQDQYIVNYENNQHKNRISVLHGFQISSNYVFRRLVQDAYGTNPSEFTSRLHSYNLGANFDFELTERGSGRPSIPGPDEAGWSGTSLVSAAIGYSVKVTPLQVVTFYNAIANDGKMMKPYIVESVERNGVAEQTFGPVLLNSICSQATADTLTRALDQVTLEGTARRLRTARCKVAGKTGTARMHLTDEEKNGSRKPYEDKQGRKKHQGTFVGFFPSENPKYTAIVVTYTRLLDPGVNVYGGEVPAATFKEIVDEIWAYETEWSRSITADGEIPSMIAGNIITDRTKGAPVPDVMGMGLKDAMFAIENSGFLCSFEGMGHVASQEPAAGSNAEKGKTIKIVLK